MPSLCRLISGSFFALALLGAPAAAQYPNKPIAVVVPFAAGGPTDVVTRLVGDHMARTLGQPVIVENIGGAGGTIGMTRAVQAKPDGYTIAVGNMGTQSAAPALYPSLKYDPAASFAQIGIVNYTPQAIVAKKSMTAGSLKEFIDHLKVNHSKLTYGHAGVGSISHVAGLVFNARFGFKPTLVPYRGTGPAIQDLVGGQLDYMVDQSLNVIPQIKAGTIKVYGIAATERLASLPDVPTAREAGDDFIFSAMGTLRTTLANSAPAYQNLIRQATGDLKRTLELNDQARVATVKALARFRDTMEDLGRALQICARGEQ
jgi:tripartite-type tricarboxylate transporter receptor subunit TctC